MLTHDMQALQASDSWKEYMASTHTPATVYIPLTKKEYMQYIMNHLQELKMAPTVPPATTDDMEDMEDSG